MSALQLKSDEFGKHIIYYKKLGGDFKFSDNLAALVTQYGHSGFSPKGITSYLTFRYPIGNNTMFEDVYKIPCATELINGNFYEYWFPKFVCQQISLENAIITIEKILLQELKRLTEGCHRVCIPLSGGVDSSLVVALTNEVLSTDKIYTYSAGFYGDDEFEYSRLIAKIFGTKHKEKILTRDDYIGEKSLLKPLIRFKAEPLHPNEIALAAVENIAMHDGCDIAICGEGSDDIFGGYGQILRMYLNYDKSKPFFEYFLDNYRYFSLSDREIIKDEYLVDDAHLLNDVLVEEELPTSIENYVFYFIQKIHTVGLITRGANAMRFNKLKLGFPYLNMKLVNFVNSLPFDYKVHWKSEEHKQRSQGMYFRDISEKMDIPKYILKKIAEKYLPSEIIYRPKYGFPVPFEKWMSDIDQWDLDKDIFKYRDISKFNGWKKFMLINLDTFVKIFR